MIRVPLVLAIASVAPVLAGAALLLSFIVTEVAGESPLAYPAPRNLAEAAGRGSAADMLRFLQRGDDPAAIVDVRPEIISSAITRVSALEAAVWSRRLELITLLEERGALGDEHSRAHLACLGEALRTTDIVSHLAASGVSGCDPDAVMKSIESRKP